MDINKGIKLWNRAKKIIPGGSQLLSKRSEMFLPEQWPSYYKKAKGVEIWDLDGNKYIDVNASIGACILGYADPDVNRAVKKAIDNGSNSTLNPPEEVELAELLCKLHSWAKMVRYARGGGEAMAVAVRIARAYSGKGKVAFCGYHGWQDWYLAANLANDKNLDGHLLPGLEPRGVPRELKGTAIPFHYNKIEELEKIVSQNKDIGVIVMEPLRHEEPKNNFLKQVRKIADKIGAVLIFDEVTIGWRLNIGGVHLKYGVNPDLAVFAKGISNGFPMAAIIGREKVMQAAQTSFISSSSWTERIGPAAALATIKKMIEKKVPQHLNKIGKFIIKGLKQVAENNNLKITVAGPPPLISFSFNYGEESQAIRTLFTQEMLKRGILISGGIYLTYSFKEKEAKRFLKAVAETFGLLKKAIDNNQVRWQLRGPIAHAGFKRLT
ncbi:MAG: aminotransferase class III-fold pyridoxal phosphate-dependent enzyme [Patescibacteria group bacterium]|nr:aminotransferase class III-fold pyridoxal phosphate-dependent enzyme [Patescibacteria group bacterium]MDD5294605.1 aminotransferase class III-fold pyridoxal phosphate-dependent enzyme [Patescibacteria group bacterium]MDD5554638.1 aminotransferase class III-fold pyridoxal phosphate-dependent enzyme [Patescibacteria group bacterium]